MFYISKITHNVSFTEHNSEITNPIRECQFNKNKLNFDDCFDSDDEVIYTRISNMHFVLIVLKYVSGIF